MRALRPSLISVLAQGKRSSASQLSCACPAADERERPSSDVQSSDALGSCRALRRSPCCATRAARASWSSTAWKAMCPTLSRARPSATAARPSRRRRPGCARWRRRGGRRERSASARCPSGAAWQPVVPGVCGVAESEAYIKPLLCRCCASPGTGALGVVLRARLRRGGS